VLATLQRFEERVGASQLNAETLQRKGLALRHIGRLDEAIETLAIAQQRDPQSQEIVVQLAESQFAAGQFARAQETLTFAQALGPLSPQARDLLANIEANFRSAALLR
jgi:tetratricopeptide (TPR) repeat protein